MSAASFSSIFFGIRNICKNFNAWVSTPDLMSSGREIIKLCNQYDPTLTKRCIHPHNVHVCKIMKTSTVFSTTVFSRAQVIAGDLYGLLIFSCSSQFFFFYSKFRLNFFIQK